MIPGASSYIAVILSMTTCLSGFAKSRVFFVTFISFPFLRLDAAPLQGAALIGTTVVTGFA